MSHSATEITFQTKAATESNWPWIVQGQVEPAWVMLGIELQQKALGAARSESWLPRD